MDKPNLPGELRKGEEISAAWHNKIREELARRGNLQGSNLLVFNTPSGNTISLPYSPHDESNYIYAYAPDQTDTFFYIFEIFGADAGGTITKVRYARRRYRYQHPDQVPLAFVFPGARCPWGWPYGENIAKLQVRGVIAASVGPIVATGNITPASGVYCRLHGYVKMQTAPTGPYQIIAVLQNVPGWRSPPGGGQWCLITYVGIEPSPTPTVTPTFTPSRTLSFTPSAFPSPSPPPSGTLGDCSGCDEGPCSNCDQGGCSSCDEGGCGDCDQGGCISCDENVCSYCDQGGCSYCDREACDECDETCEACDEPPPSPEACPKCDQGSCIKCDEGVCDWCDEGPCSSTDFGPCTNCDQGWCMNCDDSFCAFTDDLPATPPPTPTITPTPTPTPSWTGPCAGCDEGPCHECDEGPCRDCDDGPCYDCDDYPCFVCDEGSCQECDDPT